MNCKTLLQKSFANKTLVSKLMSNRSGKMKSYVAILLVSVGKENFEGEALKSAIEMINREFQGCCIAVADTLQRYNIASEKGVSPEMAYDESLVMGDKWLEKYQSYFSENFEIPYEILRWDSLLQDADFEKKSDNFSYCLESCSSLAEAMRHSIEEYGKRLRKRLSEDYFNQIQSRYERNCLSYLREECVALTYLPKKIALVDEQTPVVIVYPGKPTSILVDNRELFIKAEFNQLIERYSDYLNWLAYRFNKQAPESKQTNFNEQSKLNSIDISKEADVSIAKFDHIKLLSEVQLNTVIAALDYSLQSIFESCVLDFLLNKDGLFCDGSNQSGVNGASDIIFLSKLFSMQMMAIFETLDKKHANLCKANLIKILKKRQVNSFNLKLVQNVGIHRNPPV